MGGQLIISGVTHGVGIRATPKGPRALGAPEGPLTNVVIFYGTRKF